MSGSPEPLLPHLGASWVQSVTITPEDAFAALEAEGGDVVWLDSSSQGAHVIGVGGHRVLVPSRGADGVDPNLDAIGMLRAAQQEAPGAWVGWFGYEAGVRMLGLEPLPSRFLEAAWMLLDRWVVITAEGAQLQSRDGAPWVLPARGRRERRGALATPADLSWRDGDEAYAAKVEACRAHIRDGDSYVLCLTTAIDGPPIDAVATHERLRAASRVHHGGFLRIGGTTLVSASPETFLHVAEGRARTRPIKGTRRRGAGDDGELATELFESEKERAENVMIVDLCRNDLQRVCEPGTVEVRDLFAVETYTTVHQLVSTVEGVLSPGVRPLDVVRALFPAGSMTGAPKRRTVELLQGLEASARGVYSGCFGVVTPEMCHLAMVIRSIVADERGSHIGVGGGITALSDAAAEVEEVHIKARALIDSLVAAPDAVPLLPH